jgi:hypothetical protein
VSSKHVIEGNIEGRIEVTERRGRIRKQLLDNHKETKKILDIEGALDRTLWRTRCGRCYGSVVRLRIDDVPEVDMVLEMVRNFSVP